MFSQAEYNSDTERIPVFVSLAAMQYFKPPGLYFVGDCMPFSHQGVFHLYYLLDENHHQGLNGLGGHQWAHASTKDLIHWEHHPLALALSAENEGSICTGSVFFHAGVYHAYHGTRLRDWTQHLSHATSQDGIRFSKDPVPLGFPPAGYSPLHYRDPFVYQDEAGKFQMLITAQIEAYPLYQRGGCLLRLSSADLQSWTVEKPFLIPGGEKEYGSIPECPDLFYWKGWYYLLFGIHLQTHYRMARALSGPWLRPAVDVLDNQLLAVMKTAPFGAGRRIGAGWVGCRKGNHADGQPQWGGNVVFRELVQFADGSLGTRFPAEMIPTRAEPIPLQFCPLTPGCCILPAVPSSLPAVRIEAPDTLEAGKAEGLPPNFYLSCRVNPRAGSTRFGLGLRGEGNMAKHYDLAFSPYKHQVDLEKECLDCVAGLDQPFDLEIVVVDDLIDVCIGHSRSLINRLPELKGNQLFLFCENGAVSFEQIEIRPLLNPWG
jgi:beta-fructofuranosidase